MFVLVFDEAAEADEEEAFEGWRGKRRGLEVIGDDEDENEAPAFVLLWIVVDWLIFELADGVVVVSSPPTIAKKSSSFVDVVERPIESFCLRYVYEEDEPPTMRPAAAATGFDALLRSSVIGRCMAGVVGVELVVDVVGVGDVNAAGVVIGVGFVCWLGFGLMLGLREFDTDEW